MTCLDMLKMDRPDIFENSSFKPIIFCPYDRGYLKGDKPPHCPRNRVFGPFSAFDLFIGGKDPCAICWNMPVKEDKHLRGGFVSDEKKIAFGKPDETLDRVREIVKDALERGKIVSLYFHKDGDISMDILDKDEN